MTTSIYQSLLFQTRLKPYLDEVSVSIVDFELVYDYSGIISKFDNALEVDTEKAIVDLADFITYGEDMLDTVLISSLKKQFIDLIFKLESDSNSDSLQPYLDIIGEDIQTWFKNIQGTTADDNILGSTNDEVIYGKAGNDTINGEAGDDILFGGEGNDILNGGSGYDTLIGGTGNDTLNGGDFEKDTYIFQAGYGQDTISDRGYSSSSYKDARNDVTFDDINASDTVFNRVGNTLIIQTAAEDSITLVNYFTGTYDRAYNFIFADKTISSEDVLNMSYTLTGNDEANVLDGWSSNDIVDGKAGDDTLNGEAGDDILFGGEGNDILNGGSGYVVVN